MFMANNTGATTTKLGAPTMQSYPVATGAPMMGAPTPAMPGPGDVMLGQGGQMHPEMLKRLMAMRQGQGAMHASANGLANGRGFGMGSRPMQPPMLPTNGVLGLIRGKQSASQLLPGSSPSPMNLGGYTANRLR